MDQFIVKSEFSTEKLKQKSIIRLIVDRLSLDLNQICFIDCTVDRKWTRSQVLESSLNFAYYLIKELNVRKGEVICFATNNCDIHAIGLVGVLAAGAVYCSVRDDIPELEVSSTLTKIKPSVIICSGQNFDIIQKYSQLNTFIKKILVLDVESKCQTKRAELSVEEIFQRTRHSDVALPIETEPNDLITFVMTSGSTGQPKVILKTNRNYLSLVESLDHKEFNQMTPNDTIQATGFCHISGQSRLFCVINGGSRLAINRIDKDPETMLQVINKYEISHAFLFPTQLNFLAKNYQKFDKIYLKSIRDMLTGGAPISEYTYKFIAKEFNFENFKNCWGMSEMGWGTQTPLSLSKDLKNCQTIGKVVPNTEIKIIDSNGRSLPANEQGEICARSEQVTPGYLDNETENSKLFTSDGFLRSGDIGYYDDNHFFYIVSRIKDMIIVDSINVYPSELEEILMTHSDVENAAVIGVDHMTYNEVPLAFVTLVKGSTVSEQTLIDYVDSRVNYYKKLKGGLKILEAFPMTSLRKINKTELRKMVTNK